jgi:putative alpha-1,2-mannosidase
MNGGAIEFVMGNEPNREWGTKPKDCPPDMMEAAKD